MVLPIDGMADSYGATFAVPAVGEKGYLDVRIEVLTKGGHSSFPPEHTVWSFRVHSAEPEPDQTSSRVLASSPPSSSILKPTPCLRTSTGKPRSTKRSNVLDNMHPTSRRHCAARLSALRRTNEHCATSRGSSLPRTRISRRLSLPRKQLT